MAQIRKQAPDIGSSTPSWHAEAACRDLGEADKIFFPHAKEQEQFGASAAVPYCGVCPVMYECLKAALDGNEYGTWGGMTHSERLRLKSRIRSEDVRTVADLRELLEVTMPRCADCDRHRKPKEGGRCAECHRAHLKAEEAAEAARKKAECSMPECSTEVHAKGKCTKHYHADLRAAKPKDGPARSRKSRAKKAEEEKVAA